jgi:hypothetical protein
MRQTTSATSGPFRGQPASIPVGAGDVPSAASHGAEGAQRVRHHRHLHLVGIHPGRDGLPTIRRP